MKESKKNERLIIIYNVDPIVNYIMKIIVISIIVEQTKIGVIMHLKETKCFIPCVYVEVRETSYLFYVFSWELPQKFQ